eukprot:g7093.t1
MVRTALAPSASLRDTGDATTWQNLNGLWEWEPIPAATKCCGPMPIPAIPPPPFGRALNQSILVPFPMESCLSGVAPTSMANFHRSMWYRLTFALDRDRGLAARNARTLLHFGAVDWQSAFWVNGQRVADHTGGYDAIDIDITEALGRKSVHASLHELFVYVYDPTDYGFQPNGKQSIAKDQFPGGGHYTSTSGIWQTVWLELVPAAAHISAISLGQNSTHAVSVSATVLAHGAVEADTNITFRAFERGRTLPIATVTAAPGAAALLEMPEPRLWSPSRPYLYDLTATLGPGSDNVVAYFGLRTIRVGRSAGGTAMRPLLNGNATFFAGWLDQSWWPDGQYTAPSDDALASDIAAVSTFGLNMVRLHMKVNPERWYYHADMQGVVVFQDMPQVFVKPAAAGPEVIPAFVADLVAMIAGRKNHPSIVQFTVTNEDDCWEIFNSTAPYNLSTLLGLVRNLAPDHLIDMNSGGSGVWQQVTAGMNLGDVNDYHAYPAPARIPNATATQYAMLGEFGGAGAFVPSHNWGKCFAYLALETPLQEAQAYVNMTKILLAAPERVSASVYTQITDVEDECDGFLNYDRTNKFDELTTEMIAAANRALVLNSDS